MGCARDYPPKRKPGNSVDTQTRHALKQDRFVNVTATGLDWLGENRSTVLRWSIAGVLAIAIVVAAFVVYNNRSEAANAQLGQALNVYETPLAQPNQPSQPGMTTFPSAKDRAKAAFPLFNHIANEFPMLRAGEMARYFAGMTSLDMGSTTDAEADLTKAAGSHDSNLAALAKIALANLYAQTGRNSQAIEEFRNVIAHPTTTVPKASAQLQLAQLYEATQPEEARRLYAEIKDQDKDSDAAQIATQKLAGLK